MTETHDEGREPTDQEKNVALMLGKYLRDQVFVFANTFIDQEFHGTEAWVMMGADHLQVRGFASQIQDLSPERQQELINKHYDMLKEYCAEVLKDHCEGNQNGCEKEKADV